MQVSCIVHLTLEPDGTVQSAVFEPPLAPDLNECLSPTIYRLRFDHGGTAHVPMVFKY
jgi:hypothetical protein